MNFRRILVAGIILAAFVGAAIMQCVPVHAGNQVVKQFVLFNGVQTADSTPQASYWIPIRGADRIVIRAFTQAVAADTATTDSITAWTTLFGDSVSFLAKDSLGVITTNRSTTGWHQYNAFPMVLDSTSLSGDVADSTKWVAVYHAPASTNALSFVATKGGWYQFVYPLSPAPASGVINGRLSASQNGGDAMIPGYMRIRYTPKTRLTTAGFSSTAGLRTKGLNRLYAIAYVVFTNQ